MSSKALDIKVVYSASGRGRPRAASAARVSRSGRPYAVAVVGLVSLALSGVLTWFTWWRVDSEIYMVLMLKTPVVTGTAPADSPLLPPARAAVPAVDPVETPPVPAAAAEDGPTFVGATARNVIIATGYGWETLITATACALAICGGIAAGRLSGSSLRAVAAMLFLFIAAYVAWRAFSVLSEHGRAYPVRELRLGWSAVPVLLALLGVAAGRGLRGWTRFSGWMLVVTAAATVVALILGQMANAIPEAFRYMTEPTWLAGVFVGLSAWGWVLIVAAPRLARTSG